MARRERSSGALLLHHKAQRPKSTVTQRRSNNVQPYHTRPADPTNLQQTFEDYFAYLIWSAYLGLVDIFVVAVYLYILTARRVI